MKRYSYCIQCTDKTSGKVGDFVFDKERPFVAISPVFDNLGELYRWMIKNKYQIKSYSDDGTTHTPFDCIKVDEASMVEAIYLATIFS